MIPMERIAQEWNPMKTFLAAGDILINPRQLSYAVVETDSEGLHLRLGFADRAGGAPGELRLSGLEARAVLRWLRHNAEFLDSGGFSLYRDRPPSQVVAPYIQTGRHCHRDVPAPVGIDS
jgi:hypothetical protein